MTKMTDNPEFHAAVDALCDMGYSVVVFDDEGYEFMSVPDTAMDADPVPVTVMKLMCVGWFLSNDDAMRQALAAIDSEGNSDAE